jgi:alkylated DNA repair dioxygenase AlkB
MSNILEYKFEDNCTALLFLNYITNPNDLLNKIIADINFEQKHIKMFGKIIKLPRLTAFAAQENHEYKYSGIINKSIEFTPYMNVLSDNLGSIGSQIMPGSLPPNSCFMNYYKNGEDYIGWHSDDEYETYLTNPIYSISLGECRLFEIRRKKMESAPITKIKLEPGSLLIMYGNKFQTLYEHRLPKDNSVNARINLTFRRH